MDSVSVSLPNSLHDWARSRVESGRYADVNEYVHDLIRRDQAASVEAEQRLTSLDAAVSRSIADADAGRVRSLDEVCDELDSRYSGMEHERGFA